MKHGIIIIIMVCILASGTITGICAQTPDEHIQSAPEGAVNQEFSALDLIDPLKESLNEGGFSLEHGEVKFWDFVKDTCDGILQDTLANNPWPNAYISLWFRPHDNSSPLNTWWQIREDEAILLVGQTPPPAKYYSFQTFLSKVSNFPGRAGYPVGDAINSGTIHTIGSDKFNTPIVIIIVANQETERRIKEAVLKAGFPEEIINVETISPHIAPLGITDNLSEGTWLAFAHRVAVPENQTALEQYVRSPPYQVYRITPKEPIPSDPEPVPILRVQGTGKTEMDLYPSLQKLRQAILEKYSSYSNDSGLSKELDTHIWNLTTRRDNREMIVEKPYVGVQRGYQAIGASRDTNYLATSPNFMLRNGTDEFAFVYGVNHEKTGKVTYSSVSIYADKDRWFGLKNGTMFNYEFEGSAERYLPDDPNAQYLYAIKVARDCGDEDYCLEAAQPDFTDINGNVYPCVLGDFLTGDDPHAWNIDENEIFFIFRSYMEPGTNVAPDDNELLYDRAIYFGPFFIET